MRRSRPVLVIHGGTGARPDRQRLAHIRRSLQVIAHASYNALQTRSALEAVTLAVQLMEDDPLFNAGTGSVLQADGRARMSASVMDGPSRRFSAVLNIERVRHPILVAHALLHEPDRVLADRGAVQFARTRGFGDWNPVTAQRLQQWRARRRERISLGTVGAVALDRHGRLAAATSTGGRGFERMGRVSDSGVPVGNFAAGGVAVSCTGVGEDIMDEGLAVRLAQQVEDGYTLARAFARTFRQLRAHRRRAGAIAVDHHGRVSWATTQPVLFALHQTAHHQRESF